MCQFSVLCVVSKLAVPHPFLCRFLQKEACTALYVLLKQKLLTASCACCSVIQFKEVFLTTHHLAIVMEFAPGGDMFQFVKASGGLKVGASSRRVTFVSSQCQPVLCGLCRTVLPVNVGLYTCCGEPTQNLCLWGDHRVTGHWC